MEDEMDRDRALFDAGRYAELDALELRSRDLGVTLSDGQPLRAAYWSAFTCPCGASTREQQFERAARMREGLDAWKKANPQSRSVRLADALSLIQYGWALRGGGYGRDVTPADYAAFQEKIAAAGKLLDAMASEMKEEPEWYNARLQVLREGDGDNSAAYEVLLEEAMQRHPKYLPIYFEGFRNSGSSWRGSAGDRRTYVESVVRRTHDWAGEIMYARLNWAGGSDGMFVNGQAKWPRMKAGLEQLVAAYPDAWNLNNFGRFACLARDAATLRTLLEKVQGRVVIDAWNGMEHYALCKQFAEAAAPAK